MLSLLSRTKLHIPARLWVELTTTLHSKTEGVHESGAFLLGRINGCSRHVVEIVYYDAIDSNAYKSGVVVIHASSFGALWAHCRETEFQVVADVHVHVGSARQSRADKEHPMIAQKRHLALILPDFAAPPVEAERIGLYEYRGCHQWRNLGHGRIARHLIIGI